MATAQTLTPQETDSVLDADVHKPVTVAQQKLSPTMVAYIRAFAVAHPDFSWDVKLDRNNAHNDLTRMWPKLPGFEEQAKQLQDYICDVIGAVPVSKATATVLLRISTVTSKPVIASIPQPNEVAVIANFDADDALWRQYTVPVFDELPTFDDMSIKAGLSLLCQLVPPLFNNFGDNRPVGLGGGTGVYGDRTNHDPLLAGNNSGDPEAIVQMPLGASYYMHLPTPQPPVVPSPSQMSPTPLSSQVMEDVASMTALAAVASSEKSFERQANARDGEQAAHAARLEQQQTVAAARRQASPSLVPVMGAAGVGALAQEAAASQTGPTPGAPQPSILQAEVGESPTRPILRDLPALDDSSLSPTDRAQMELQIEQEAVREAQDAGEITSSEAVALDRMPNAYEREERLETEEEQRLPEAYLEGEEPSLRTAGEQAFQPEGATLESATVESGEPVTAESSEPAVNREAYLGQGIADQEQPTGERTPINEALFGAEGEVLGGSEPASERTAPDLRVIDEPQLAAAEITGEPSETPEPTFGAEQPVRPEAAANEAATSNLAVPQGGTPSTEGEGTTESVQEPSTSPDETAEPRANATVPEPVRSGEQSNKTAPHEPDSTQSEASLKDVKEEFDQVREKLPEPDFNAAREGRGEPLDNEESSGGTERPSDTVNHEQFTSHSEGVSENRLERLHGADRSNERDQALEANVHHPVMHTADAQEGGGSDPQLDQLHHISDAVHGDVHQAAMHTSGEHGGSVIHNQSDQLRHGHSVLQSDVHHPVLHNSSEQGASAASHQLDQLHHMHEALGEPTAAPYIRPDVGLMHGAHSEEAYRSLPQPSTGSQHNPALSSHPLTPPVIVSSPLRTGQMIQNLQPAVAGLALSSANRGAKKNARTVKAGSVAAPSPSFEKANASPKKQASSKVTSKPVKAAAALKAAGQSKRQSPVAAPAAKASDFPTPEPGGL